MLLVIFSYFYTALLDVYLKLVVFQNLMWTDAPCKTKGFQSALNAFPKTLTYERCGSPLGQVHQASAPGSVCHSTRARSWSTGCRDYNASKHNVFVLLLRWKEFIIRHQWISSGFCWLSHCSRITTPTFLSGHCISWGDWAQQRPPASWLAWTVGYATTESHAVLTYLGRCVDLEPHNISISLNKFFFVAYYQKHTDNEVF